MKEFIKQHSVEIIRLEENSRFGTFGVLKINKVLFCCTLEPPDLLNAQGRSSIPEQQYICVPFSGPKYKNVYEVSDVFERTKVLFHAGNVLRDTKGCIILGEKFGKLGEARATLNSGKTFKAFRKIIGNNEFHLTIKNAY